MPPHLEAELLAEKADREEQEYPECSACGGRCSFGQTVRVQLREGVQYFCDECAFVSSAENFREVS